MNVGSLVRFKDTAPQAERYKGQAARIIGAWALGGVELRWPDRSTIILPNTDELEPFQPPQPAQ